MSLLACRVSLIAVFAGAALAMPVPALPAESTPASFVARGNEPFWRLDMTDSAITFQAMGADALTVSPKPEAVHQANSEIFHADLGGKPFMLTISDRVCTDTMSGMPHPKTVAVKLGDHDYSGCGGDPATLLHGEWSVTQIDGKDIVAGSQPTLAFDADGRISGNGSCNRYFGSYTLTGEGLSLADMGQTNMACEEPLMRQEYAFFKILEATARFEITPDNGLVLHAADGRTAAARRK